jgi:hypothetical protein
MTMTKTTIVLSALLVALSAGAAEAQQPAQLNIAIYAPSADFADSGARLAYVQGLARAIQQKTGIPTTGKAYVRLGDLTAAKPDFAIVEGLCIATKNLGQVLATAQMGGGTTQSWGLYTRGGESFSNLKGKKLAYVKTDCRDADFLDNAMMASEVKTKSHFASLVDKQDVKGAVAAVKDYKQADGVFAPAGQARGLTRVFDTIPVPNPGFVVLAKGLPAATVSSVQSAVLGYGASGGIDGWKAATSYRELAGDLGTRVKRGIFAAPDVVRMDDSDVLIVPSSEFQHATVRQHFWEPAAANP